MADLPRSPVKRSYSRYENERDERETRDEREPREDRDDRDGSSRHKRRRTSDDDASPPEIEYRILCPVAKIGSVIGKGGSIIKSLREETRAKIKVEDVIHGADERIVYITSATHKDREGRDSRHGDDDRYDMLCPAQDALFRIFACITECDDRDSGSRRENDDAHVTVRLLVSDGQVGCLIGKGGRIIEQMRKDIAAQIRVLSKANLPPCAFPNDELVQLSGTPALVKEALYAVSTKLFENPVRERSHRPSGMSQGAWYPSGGLHSFHAPGSVYGGMGQYGRSSSFPLRSSRSDGPLEEEFMVCVLCPNEKIGSVIGKGGSIIRKIREESGAKIRVCDQVGDSDERVIQISSLEYLDSYASPTLEAVMQVFKRLADIYAERDGRHAVFVIRLLVPASQIGCLLGKGGQIISEIRKTSRANIRIPPKDELPSCADNNSELVQVSGQSATIESALIQVLTKLRTNLFTGRGGGRASQHVPPYSGRDRRDDRGSPVRYPYDYGNYGTSPRSSKDSRHRLRY
ncbi:hypothetical protein KP509_02G052900 [Ceratopteris richardii]|uniref:K Homology domain-containing protein n=1 Tax=Ceratopteris richardii TaxID=49495 RepID=A0A8T2VHB6_CERRI|nr:hypothetical protein KP509_02G052900 [Ceratopteris richardii]